MMRLEGFGRRPSRNGVKHWGLHLDETPMGKKIADLLNRLDSGKKNLFHPGVGDEV
jgi:hypothetical protein